MLHLNLFRAIKKKKKERNCKYGAYAAPQLAQGHKARKITVKMLHKAKKKKRRNCKYGAPKLSNATTLGRVGGIVNLLQLHFYS